MDHKKQVDLVFLDFSKAFDRVSHDLLLAKLKNFALNTKVINVIQAFLSNRIQRVVVEGSVSSSQPVTSGVPQGSVLGPLLFILFINDLCSGLSSSIRLFADDTVVYREINSPDDHRVLQDDMNCIVNWCKSNQMSLNAQKCNIMSVTRLHHPSLFDYIMNDIALARVNVYKYLGIHITSDLSWDTHINYVCSQANRALGFVRRQLGKCAVDVKLKAYTTLVRPHLEYASCSWDPHTDSHADQIEMVQHRAARFILGRYSHHESVTQMLNELNLHTLKSRRKNARLCLFFKIDKGLTPLVTPPQLTPKAVQRRTDNGRAYEHISSHSNPLYDSFYPRTVRDWNLLSPNLVSLSNLDAFSNLLGYQRSVCSH
jgi:hypothetical protein